MVFGCTALGEMPFFGGCGKVFDGSVAVGGGGGGLFSFRFFPNEGLLSCVPLPLPGSCAVAHLPLGCRVSPLGQIAVLEGDVGCARFGETPFFGGGGGVFNGVVLLGGGGGVFGFRVLPNEGLLNCVPLPLPGSCEVAHLPFGCRVSPLGQIAVLEGDVGCATFGETPFFGGGGVFSGVVLLGGGGAGVFRFAALPFFGN